MPLEGRGTSYSRARAMVEWGLIHAYRKGWPAQLAHALGLEGRLRTVHHRVRARTSTPLRVAFASDFHAGPTTHPAQLDAATHALDAARADVVLLGGDYVFLTSHQIGDVASRLREVHAPLGKYAVLGNHDLW